MDHQLTDYPTGGPEDWRGRYEPVIEDDRGDGIDGAAITAVIVTWVGGADDLDGSLRSIRSAAERLAEPVEILVVDNGTPTQLADELDDLWDRWIRFGQNLNPSPARNLGVATASADIVAFVDDDGHVAPDYFRAALRYFDDPDVVAIRGRVTALEHPYFTTLATHYDRGPNPVEDALVTEGASFVRRDALIDAGGFPDELLGHEGIALTCRLQRSAGGGRILYVPDVVLRHDYLESWKSFFTKQLRYAENEAAVDDRSPEVAEFMKEYFNRSFPRRNLPPHKLTARTLLRALRAVLQGGARLFHRARNGIDL